MAEKVDSGISPYVKIDWRFVTLIAALLIPGLSFAGASILNYATISSRLTYVEEEVKAARNHNERLTTLEKLENSLESRESKTEGRMEVMIDTFQGINRDVFSKVAQMSQKLDDLSQLVRPSSQMIFTPPQVSDYRGARPGSN